MKDNFSTQSDRYAQFRPTYPDALFEFLSSIAPGRQSAWDCATGNGQVARGLTKYFDKIQATDISPQQLQNAFPSDKIEYSVQPAESTSFPDNFFDLVTVAQAIHWFEFERFYGEVKRTLKKNGVLAVIGYGRLQVSAGIDHVISELYHNIIGAFWDKERKYIEENYRTIPFPFKEEEAPVFHGIFDWTLEHLTGFLETWSAVKHFKKEKKEDPVSYIYDDLKKSWGEAPTRQVCFPLIFRIGKIEKR